MIINIIDNNVVHSCAFLTFAVVLTQKILILMAELILYVAVILSSCSSLPPLLAPNMFLLGSIPNFLSLVMPNHLQDKDFVDEESPGTDLHGHGTHVAGFVQTFVISLFSLLV